MIKKTVEISSLEELKKMKEKSDEKEKGKKLFDDKIVLLDPSILEKNPYQNRWFNINDNADIQLLRESIKKYGIKNPLQITKDNVIISGHTRCQIALQEGIKKVPCQIARYELTDNELKLHLIEDNYLNKNTTRDQKTILLNDFIEILKKEYSNWESLIREPFNNLKTKLVDDYNIAPNFAKTIVKKERRRAKVEDLEESGGVIYRDYRQLQKYISSFEEIYLNTTDDTREKIKKDFKVLIYKLNLSEPTDKNIDKHSDKKDIKFVKGLVRIELSMFDEELYRIANNHLVKSKKLFNENLTRLGLLNSVLSKGNKISCIKCGVSGKRVGQKIHKNDNVTYKCYDCDISFSPFKGSLLDGSYLPVDKWVNLIIFFITNPKMTPTEMARELGQSGSQGLKGASEKIIEIFSEFDQRQK